MPDRRYFDPKFVLSYEWIDHLVELLEAYGDPGMREDAMGMEIPDLWDLYVTLLERSLAK